MLVLKEKRRLRGAQYCRPHSPSGTEVTSVPAADSRCSPPLAPPLQSSQGGRQAVTQGSAPHRQLELPSSKPTLPRATHSPVTHLSPPKPPTGRSFLLWWWPQLSLFFHTPQPPPRKPCPLLSHVLVTASQQGSGFYLSPLGPSSTVTDTSGLSKVHSRSCPSPLRALLIAGRTESLISDFKAHKM